MEGGKRKLEDGGGGGADADATSSPSKSSRRTRGSKVVEDQAQAEVDNQMAAGDVGHSSGIIARETNPLLIELVLQNLFSHMPVKFLATSRLVCRLWRDEALPFWRGSAIPQISCSWVGAGNGDPGARTSIRKFVGFVEANCKDKPYREIRLEGWQLRESGMRLYAAKLLEVVGTKIYKLTLEHCTAAGFTSQPFFKTINQFFPNLGALVLSNGKFQDISEWKRKLDEEPRYKAPLDGEHLNLKSLRISSTGGHFLTAHSKLTFLELLTHFPHLTSLNLESGCWVRSTSASEVLKFLRVVELIRMQDSSKLPITKLDGFVVVVDQLAHQDVLQPPAALIITDLLHTLKLPPLSFRLTHKMSLNDIHNFVGLCGDGIAGLEVDWRAPFQPRTNFPFGMELQSLEHLRFPEGFCQNFEFIKYVPNLRSLRIWVDYRRCGNPVLRGGRSSLISSTSKSILADTELLNLTKLELENFTVGADDLRWLVKWMPRVKNLDMILNDEQFSIVCNNWQDLVELRVRGSELTDGGITGMWMEIGIQSRSETDCEDLDQASRPNITCLQNLNVFVASESTLTDVSLFDGLLKMRHLRRIVFKNYDKIGAEAKEAVEKLGIRAGEVDKED